MITNLQTIKDNVSMLDLCRELGIPLKERGGKASGPCPVHKGDGSNFGVKGQIAHCFSQCNKTWDTIEFLKDYKNMDFVEAVELLSRIGKTPIERTTEYTPEEKAIYESRKAHQESLRIAAEAAIKFYETPAQEGEDPDALVSFDRGEGKPAFTIKQSTVRAFRIAVTPNANALLHYVSSTGEIDIDLLDELGFIGGKENNRRYDALRNRMVLPITNHHGRVLAAAGRVTPTNSSKVKWINTANSDIFSKGSVLFGLHQNQQAISRAGAKIVEGYADVLTPYDNGIRDHVAQMGTAFADGQLTILRRFTDTATLIYDQDKAGREAARRNVPLFLAAGFFTNVCFLPEKTAADPEAGTDAEKYDPDSYIRDRGAVAYKQYVRDETVDGFRWLITDLLGDYADPKKPTPTGLVTEVIKAGAEILSTIEGEVYKADAQAWMQKQLGNKKHAQILAKRATILEAEGAANDDAPDYSDQERSDIEKYCVYDRGNRIYSADDTSKWGMKITNFVMRPVIFVKSGSESKMLLELKNVGEVVATIMVSTDDLVDLGPIKKILLATGNFLFEEWVKPHHWARILKRLMDDRAPAYTISTLGRNAGQNFYAWANGISLPDGSFIPIDDYGIVSHGKHKFLLPAFGKVHTFNPAEEDDNEYEDQKPFVYAEDQEAPTVAEWVDMFTEVYGDSGVVAMAWYLAAIFRSEIYPRFNCFPILNPWGPPGAGKSFMCDSLMAMFGHSYVPFNLTAGTDVGFFRMMAQKVDAVVSYDEYKNAISFTRVQALKNAYDGAGRTKGKKTNDNRTSTTKVRSAIIMAGQEQPTQDPALMSRCISLAFTKADYSDAEKANAKRLKDIESTAAMSKVTAKLLTYREEIRTRFIELYTGIESELNNSIPAGTDTSVAPRMVQNNAMVLTTFRIIADAIPEIKLKYERVRKIMGEVMLQQMASISQEDDLAKWWDMFEFHYSERMLRDYKHLEVQQEEVLKVQKHPQTGLPHDYDFTLDGAASKKILYLIMNTPYRLFADRVKREDGIKPMGKDAIRHYLQGHASYLGVKKKKLDKRAQWVMVFDMDRLPFDLQLSIETKQLEDDLPDEHNAPPLTRKEAAEMATITSINPSTGKPFDDKGEDLPF